MQTIQTTLIQTFIDNILIHLNKMKVSNLPFIGTSLFVLATLPTQSKALKCGIKGVTKPCIGDTDSRYNQDVSYNLKEQNNFWKSLEGLYVQNMTFWWEGAPDTNAVIAPGIGTFDFANAKSFLVRSNNRLQNDNLFSLYTAAYISSYHSQLIHTF